VERHNEDRHETEAVPAELIERCKSGDQAAWRELVEATYRDVYSLCLRILRDPDDAVEATQDAYLKAWRGLKGFRGDAQFSTWLYRVASNAAISKLRSRKRRREREVGEEALEVLESPGSTEERASVLMDMQRLEQALRVLPEHYRAAIVLRDVYGLTIGEVSERLGISETAAKVRVHRGRKKLKDMLYESGEEERRT
jgi:RNA polymerase sigma-70 factor (ECF subfamily)